jgi:DNA-binding transcriptional LysR family regulator
MRMRRSSGAIAPWTFVDGNKRVEVIVSGPLIAYDFPTMLGAALEGLGLAQVPQPGTIAPIKAGKLVTMLEPFAPATEGMFLYYPGNRRILPKLRAFIDHVKSSGAAGPVRSKKR